MSTTLIPLPLPLLWPPPHGRGRLWTWEKRPQSDGWCAFFLKKYYCHAGNYECCVQTIKLHLINVLASMSAILVALNGRKQFLCRR